MRNDINIINLSNNNIEKENIYNINDFESIDFLLKNLEGKYVLFTYDISNLNLEKIYKLNISEEEIMADIILFLDYIDFLPNNVEINFLKEKFLESLFVSFENILFTKDIILNRKIQKEDLVKFSSFNYKIFNENLSLYLKEEYILKSNIEFKVSISDIFCLKKMNNKQKYLYIYNILNNIIDIKINIDKQNLDNIFKVLRDEINKIDIDNYKEFLKAILNTKQFDLINTILLILKYGQASQFIFFCEQIRNERKSTIEIKRLNLKFDNLDFIIKSKSLNIAIAYDKTLDKIKKLFSYIKYNLTKVFFIGKDIWLIGERRDQAEDNAFRFFKYVRENHPKENIYYIIHKDSIQYQDVKKLGNVIEADSFKHKLYLMNATKLISAYDFFKFLLPNDNNNFKNYYLKHINPVRIFLQHGISMNKANYYNKYINKYDYLLASTNKEFNMFVKEYSYEEDKIIRVGLPRYDELIDLSKNNKRKKILFMPTWRNDLVELSFLDFKDTEYYKKINDLINDYELNKFIEENDLELIVYLHYEMQIFNECFKFYGKNISFRDRTNSIVQQLLKECNLLITDYSSVGVDFAYLDKPVIFYQFSNHNFHYNINKEEEYTLYSDFGRVVLNKNDVINSLKEWKYKDYKNFYPIDDKLFFNRNSLNNCEKIYRFLKEIPKKNNKYNIIEIKKENNSREKRVYDKNYDFIKREFYNGKVKTSELIYKDGFIKKQILYNSDKKILKIVDFYKNIKISSKYRDIYDKKGNLKIKHEATKEGILISKTSYYAKSKKVESITRYNLENQKVSSIEHFYKNGNIKSKLIYNEDGFATKYLYYSEKGSLLREYDYYSTGKVKCKKFYYEDSEIINKVQIISEINERIISEDIFDINGNKNESIKYVDF